MTTPNTQVINLFQLLIESYGDSNKASNFIEEYNYGKYG